MKYFIEEKSCIRYQCAWAFEIYVRFAIHHQLNLHWVTEDGVAVEGVVNKVKAGSFLRVCGGVMLRDEGC